MDKSVGLAALASAGETHCISQPNTTPQKPNPPSSFAADMNLSLLIIWHSHHQLLFLHQRGHSSPFPARFRQRRPLEGAWVSPRRGRHVQQRERTSHLDLGIILEKSCELSDVCRSGHSSCKTRERRVRWRERVDGSRRGRARPGQLAPLHSHRARLSCSPWYESEVSWRRQSCEVEVELAVAPSSPLAVYRRRQCH